MKHPINEFRIINTHYEACQLEFRATKFRKAHSAAYETPCSQALIGEAFAGSHQNLIIMGNTNNTSEMIQGSQLIKKVRPEKGFFIKTRERYISKDGNEHSRFIWEPVTVGDMWVEKIGGNATSISSCTGPTAQSIRLTNPSANSVSKLKRLRL